MKSVIVVLLAAVFMFQSASKLLILSDYALNKALITKTFCENKKKPKSTCNGKCHLAKQLKKQDKKEKPNTNSQKEKIETQFYSDNNPFDNLIFATEQNPPVIFYQFARYSNYLDAVFQPPRA